MIKLQAKIFKLNLFWKPSELLSIFTFNLTLSYLYPALNNPGQTVNDMES